MRTEQHVHCEVGPLTAGDPVKVIDGPYKGRTGVVQAVSLDGAAVRLASRGGDWPFPEVRVIGLVHLRARRRAARSKPAAGTGSLV